MRVYLKKYIKNRKRNIYEIFDKKTKKNKYYYRLNNKKVYIKKPRNLKHKNYDNYKFNPGDKSKAFDVYIDKNPKDTIPIKYKTLKDVKSTIKKLEKLYKSGKYTHKRIWQVGMILHVRLRAMKGKTKEKALAKKYFKFLGERTKINGKNKDETFNKRKKLIFKII